MSRLVPIAALKPTGTESDGDAILWDADAERYAPGQASLGATALVPITSAVDGEFCLVFADDGQLMLYPTEVT